MIHTGFHVPGTTQDTTHGVSRFPYAAFMLYGRASQHILVPDTRSCEKSFAFSGRPTTPWNRNAKRLDTIMVWAFPDSLATTTGILSFPQGTLDVSVPLVPSAFAVAFRLGCPIRRSWDHCLLATPPSFSQRCHVLLRHMTPRHPPYAHSVFPVGTSCTCLDSMQRACATSAWCSMLFSFISCSGTRHSCRAPSPLNRDYHILRNCFLPSSCCLVGVP